MDDSGRTAVRPRIGSGESELIALIIGILVSLLVTIAGTPMLIHLVHRLHYGQYIRQDGPKSHLVKRGTPTMGGVAIVLAIVLGWGASALYRYVRSGAVPSLSAMLVLFAMLSMGLLGFIDDFAKVRKNRIWACRCMPSSSASSSSPRSTRFSR